MRRRGRGPTGQRDPRRAALVTGTLLIVEDDPTVRDALELLFTGEGYRMIAATDGTEVAALVQRGGLMPDAIVADYNLPGGRTGLEVIENLRRVLKREIPAVVLTGDIASEILEWWPPRIARISASRSMSTN